MNKLIAALLLSIANISYGQIDKAAIDTIFKDWNQPNTPGCALGIIKNGELVYARGYGMANLEYDIPNSPTSVFRIGSTSKQFTAACIVLLQQQGKLNFDDKLSKFFPEFPDYANRITVRQLLNHSSGIRDYLQVAYLAGLADDDFYTDEDVMRWLVNQKENNFLPNEEFLYSNSGYWLLGQIVNKVSGKNMAVFAKENIFDPLGMRHTHFHNDHTMIVRNRASGYEPTDGGYRISMTTLDMIGDGGIFTTIEDLNIWDDHFYTSKVLSSQFWPTMAERLVLNNGDTLSYAKGIVNSSYKGLKTLSHGGAFVGFRAEMLRFPEQKTTIIILANRSDAAPTPKAYKIADIVLKDEFIEVDRKSSISKDVKKPFKLSVKEFDKFSAWYWNSEELYARKIYVKDDTLRYYRTENNESKLLPVGKSAFQMMSENGDINVSFSLSKENQKKMSVSVDGGKPSLFTEFVPVTYTREQLGRYAGTYYSGELGVKYDLKVKGDDLVLYVRDKEISTLKVAKDQILSSDQFGVLDFSENPPGETKQFRLMAGRVKNLEFIRQ